MTFTDDDLKHAKETWTDGDYDYLIDGQLLINLLARLETSERCLSPATDYCVICHCEDCQSNREAWRKSKGEKG